MQFLRWANAQGVLAEGFIRARPQARLRWYLNVLGARELAARSAAFSDADDANVTSIAGTTEALRAVATAVTRGKASRNAMYFSFRRFDAAVARRAQFGDWFLGLPGSSSASFAANRARSGRNVFHAVNAHPAIHNERLLNEFSRSRVESELLPRSMQDRVEAELQTADVVLSPSRANSLSFTEQGVPVSRMLEVPYGVDTSVFRPLGPSAPRDKNRGKIRFLFVGQISYRKGLTFLVDAMRNLQTTHELYIFGPIVSPRVLERLPDNVKFKGVALRAQLPELMAQSDAFVLPSIEDACALVTFEAAAAGLPVVTTTSNGAFERLPEPNVVLTEPADRADLQQKLAATRSLTPDHRAFLAANFRRSVAGSDWSDYCTSVWSGLEGWLER